MTQQSFTNPTSFIFFYSQNGILGSYKLRVFLSAPRMAYCSLTNSANSHSHSHVIYEDIFFIVSVSKMTHSDKPRVLLLSIPRMTHQGSETSRILADTHMLCMQVYFFISSQNDTLSSHNTRVFICQFGIDSNFKIGGCGELER